MKLTVIIPAYNSEDTIDECLQAIINQKNVRLNKDYCILLVDDGSTDRTVEIAQKYPIKILSLQKNQGRIIARLNGAMHAKTQKIFFVDSRVALTENVISDLNKYWKYPAVMGEELHDEDIKYETFFSTFLYLIRRKYYGKENFPLQAEQLKINKENFKRSPKGTTILFIDRELFINITPENTSKYVSNDTLLFHKLIFEQKINLLKVKELFYRYRIRLGFKKLSSWIYERGGPFSNFYLVRGGYFYTQFIIATIYIFVLFSTLTISLFISSDLFFLIIYSIILFNIFLSIYLSENIKDFFILLFSMPVIVSIFGAGILNYHVKMLCEKFSSETNHT